MAGFREFIARGNVLDLAVAVIIGGAFGTIVSSLTDDLIMPVVGAVTGGIDFSNYFVRLGPVPAGFAGDPNSYAALKAAGVPMFGYGQFITAIVNFHPRLHHLSTRQGSGAGAPACGGGDAGAERRIAGAARDPGRAEAPRLKVNRVRGGR
jgi:large conductance mechanosensitive channel protein